MADRVETAGPKARGRRPRRDRDGPVEAAVESPAMDAGAGLPDAPLDMPVQRLAPARRGRSIWLRLRGAVLARIGG